ncbi:MAG TPA: IS110 family transposase [Candidatus Lokiarchaeia archaeon]|nr:IS110 family transposase [Candidatus Lokiarchaeia archaeon]
MSGLEERTFIIAMIKKDKDLLKKLQLIITLPSVSITTGLTFLVEVIDIKFFWRPKSLVKWSGMAPRVNQSGYKKRVTGKIYKGGNKHVRLAAYNAAKSDYAHGKHSGHPIGKFVSHLYDEKKKNYKTSVTAGGAKLLR